MAVDAYLNDRSRVSISAERLTDKAAYRRAIASLESQAFWKGDANVRGLWPHQRSAIALAAAYFCSDKALATGGLEAALIKMPTGTGKSGVIAAVARCLPTVRRILVLTPRTALTDQLKDDIAHRFWGNIGYPIGAGPYTDADIEPAHVELLLPNPARLRMLMRLPAADRTVLVGTLQALDAIRITRDRLLRKLRRGDELSEEEEDKLAAATDMMAWLRNFDLVVVDEGHYEPAPSWSRSVRELRLPAVLLSATPFRNDYKLFQVKGRFVFNYPFPSACDDNIVRDVHLLEIPSTGMREPNRSAEEEDTAIVRAVTAEDRSAVADFVSGLKAKLPALLADSKIPNAKVIVRAASFEILELLQAGIERAFNEKPVLIHDRIESKKQEEAERRYNDVARARKQVADATFWLHQSKLLEGIDEPTYLVVAIFDAFTNARQFVQQVGRVLRSTDPSRKAPQTAFVLLPSDLIKAADADWTRYLEFEAYTETGLDTIVPSEAYLPEAIVGSMPQMQYVDGRFRHRLPDAISLSAADVVVPRRAAVFEIDGAFDEDVARTEILESLLASNRFVVRPIENAPPAVMGWTFFTVDESPYLANHFVTEWRFGVVVAVQVGNHLLVFDSDGVTFSPSRIGVSKPAEGAMTKLLPGNSTITQISANSLDMSDRAIRSLTQRTRSFADTFTDLLDPMLRPTTITGYVAGGGRYLGIVRAKVADATDENVSLAAFVDWAKTVEAQLTDRSVTENPVFRRYARRVVPAPGSAEKPQNILLDLTEEALEEFGLSNGRDRGSPPDRIFGYEDLCADIENNKFVVKTLDGEEVPCSIRYNPETGRYAIDSKALNERHPPGPIARGRRAISLTERLNTAQSFRVLTADVGVVYMYGEFLKARDVLAADGTVLPLECATAIPELAQTTSEKGEKIFGRTSWQSKSVFGLLRNYCDQPGVGGTNELERALRGFDLVLLDDDSSELGDFIAIGKRRLAIIHAKASSKASVGAVTKLETVGRQCSASLAFCSTMAQVDGIDDGRWERPTVFNKKTVKLSRVFRNANSVADSDLASVVRAALQNPSFEREVWIVAGRLLDVEKTRQKARKKTLTNRDRQLMMFLESLSTACGRANARLRVFGH